MAALSADSIETLFKTFARRWSHRWEKIFIDPKARALWKRDLIALSVTDQLLGVGLHKSAALDWPPSPAEFAALCHPTAAELGLPDLDTAYRRACVSNWTHSAIYEAAKRIGTFEIRSMPESKSRPLFERTYRAVCAEILAGATFEVPKRAAIEHKQDGYIGDEKFNAMRDDYRKGRSLPAVASLYRVSLCDAWSICENGKRVGEA